MPTPNYDPAVKKKSGTFGRTMSQTFSNSASDDNSLVYQLLIIAVMIIVVMLIFQKNVGTVMDAFAEIKWGPYQIDPITGNTVTGADGNLAENPHKSSFASSIFGSMGMLVILILTLLTYMFGGSRDIVYLFKRWMPGMGAVLSNLIAISPIIVHVVILVICTVVMSADPDAVGAYFYAYTITAIMISAFCCTAAWMRVYYDHKGGCNPNYISASILSVMNTMMLVYAATLLGIYSATSDDIKSYLRSRSAMYRTLPVDGVSKVMRGIFG